VHRIALEARPAAHGGPVGFRRREASGGSLAVRTQLPLGFAFEVVMAGWNQQRGNAELELVPSVWVGGAILERTFEPMNVI